MSLLFIHLVLSNTSVTYSQDISFAGSIGICTYWQRPYNLSNIHPSIILHFLLSRKLDTIQDIFWPMFCIYRVFQEECEILQDTVPYQLIIQITNVMHLILFIRQIFSSTCFEYQVLIFRRNSCMRAAYGTVTL